MKRNKLYNLFLVLIGVVVGSFVGNLCTNVKGLSWLNYGAVFGMDAPLSLNLGILDLTFAISLNLTLAIIICIILSLLIGRAIAK